MRRLELQFLYWTSRLLIFFVLPLHVTDMGQYLGKAHRFLLQGQWPYRDFSYEYPPLAYALILIPAYIHQALGSVSLELYRNLFALPILAVDYVLFRELRRNPPVKGSAFYYVLFSSFLWSLLFDRFDLLVGFFVVWPFWGKESDARFAWAWALGGALKLVTLPLIPLRLLDRRFSLGRAWRLAWPGALALVLSVGLAAILGNVSFLTHHSERGVQVESLVGNWAMLNQAWLGTVKSPVESNFGAQHLRDQDGMRLAAKMLFWWSLSASLLGLLYLGLRRRIDGLRATWLLLLGFIVFGYVLSPQFLLWILPLAFPVAAVLRPGQRGWFLGLFGLVMATTGVHFQHYWQYVDLNPWSVALLTTRNLLLVALLGCSWCWLPLPRFPPKP